MASNTNNLLLKPGKLRRRIYYRYIADYRFIHINKSGGSSVEKALGIPFQHKTALEYKNGMSDRRWQKTFCFTIVRNPWDKVVSHYHYRKRTNQTTLGTNSIPFDDWVKLAYGDNDPRYFDKPKMFMPQASWIADTDGSIIVDFIGKFENLQNDFDEICKRLKKTKRDLPHLKKSVRCSYRDYYSEESRQLVSHCFKKDIELFDYQF